MDSHNPLEKPLTEAKSVLRKLQSRCSKLERDLTWHAAFQPSEASAEVAALEQTGVRLGAEADRLQARLNTEWAVLEQRNGHAAPGWNPTYWFSGERSSAKQRAAEQRALVERLFEQHTRLQDSSVEAAKSHAKLVKDLQRYGEIDVTKCREQADQLHAEVSLQQLQLGDLELRKKKVDQRLHPLLEELARLEADDSKLEQRLARARALARQLDQASDGYQRKLIHERCEAEFSYGSTGSVISNAQRRREGLRRDIEKLHRRIKNVARASARNVCSVVIDGNNMCFADKTFIGLAALIPTVKTLVASHEVTVVFDPSITRHFNRETLREAFPQAKVHIVNSRPAADELILDVSRDPLAVVLSNDRFREFRDKDVVREGRLVRHDILKGRVAVPDLFVDVPLAGAG